MLQHGLSTDSELREWARRLHIPLNFVGFRDQLSKDLPKPGGYIINLQSADEGPGTHWTGLYLAPNKLAFIFDSFGAPPVDEVLNYAKHWTNSMKHIYINPYDIQNLNGSFCGQYVLEFLAHILHQPTPESFRHFLQKYKLFRVQKNRDTNI
jgi:hypothetical protein